MNKNKLVSVMKGFGDNQADLAAAVGLSLTRFNAKLNGKDNAEFTRPEIEKIISRYGLDPKQIAEIFFGNVVQYL